MNRIKCIACILLVVCIMACSASFSGVSAEGASPCENARPEKLKMTETVFTGADILKDYQRKVTVCAPDADHYTYAKNGVFTFRGNNWRGNAAYGTADLKSESMEVSWKYKLGGINTSSGNVYGVGWGSQPAIVKWDKTVREMMNLYPEKQSTKALREVIFAAQDGKVYFLDLLTGEATRDVINIGYPMKGSVSVDTQSRPVIAFGQSVSKLKNKTGQIGLYVYELIGQTELLFINGRSGDKQKQYSSNGAFDSTPLFLYRDDMMVACGENGLLYTVKMNTDFDYQNKKSLAAAPETIYLRSKTKDEKDARTTIESSPAMYNGYVYTADGYGILRCVDSATMKTVWAVDCGDNTDASPALDRETDGSVALYTGNTAFSRLGKKKDVTIRRLDAMTGEEMWTYNIKCAYDKDEMSGCKASPVVGEKSVGDLVFFTVNMTDGGKTSTLVALEKKTGSERWRFVMDCQTVSSPVAVYDKLGNAWIIQADGNGVLHMISGVHGNEISSLQLDGKIQASPAVYGNMLVIGTCSKNNAWMYGIKLN